jgi:hypothetical protein
MALIDKFINSHPLDTGLKEDKKRGFNTYRNDTSLVDKYIGEKSKLNEQDDDFLDLRYYPKKRQTQRVSVMVSNGDAENKTKEYGVIIGRCGNLYRVLFDDGYRGVFEESEIDWGSLD